MHLEPSRVVFVECRAPGTLLSFSILVNDTDRHEIYLNFSHRSKQYLNYIQQNVILVNGCKKKRVAWAL